MAETEVTATETEATEATDTDIITPEITGPDIENKDESGAMCLQTEVEISQSKSPFDGPESPDRDLQ